LELLPFSAKPTNSRQRNNQIALLLDKKLSKSLPEEGYELTVSKSGVVVQAPTEKGLFYGLQSLRQLALEKRDGDKVILSNVVIRDYPRFPYRGLHLDVSRHFYSKEFIKKQLDAMAFYKLNHFHWHLTDGAGWRLEIKAYPELTNKAAWRQGKWREWWNSERHYASIDDPDAYGGFYTQEDVREIVAYAAQRNITVIPEIEMPSHSEEVIAVYPELSCTGVPYSSGEYCVGNEAVFQFLETVLTEVMELFPSTYIHIGGDEANKESWKKCAKCQLRKKRE
jgi:N-acetyl-beta-hexosaminidase